MQLEALARLEENARHPAGREAQQATGGGEFGFDKFGDVLLDGLQGGERVHVPKNFVQHIDAPNTGKPFPNDRGDGRKAQTVRNCFALLSSVSGRVLPRG